MDASDEQPALPQEAGAEGHEDSEYIYIDLSDVNEDLLPKVGSTISLQGLDTETPQMVTSSGVRLAGGYEDSLGSLLIFMMQKQGSAAPAAAEPAEQSTMQTSRTVETAPAAVPGSSAQQAPAETAAGAQPCSEPIALRPEHSGMANQKQQASSSSQQPNGRSSHETGKHVRSSDKAGSKAEFLTFTDTVLRFREAT